MQHWSDGVKVLHNVCANCYKKAEKKNSVKVGSIDWFTFCSEKCALDAMKRKGAN